MKCEGPTYIISDSERDMTIIASCEIMTSHLVQWLGAELGLALTVLDPVKIKRLSVMVEMSQSARHVTTPSQGGKDGTKTADTSIGCVHL